MYFDFEDASVILPLSYDKEQSIVDGKAQFN